MTLAGSMSSLVLGHHRFPHFSCSSAAALSLENRAGGSLALSGRKRSGLMTGAALGQGWPAVPHYHTAEQSVTVPLAQLQGSGSTAESRAQGMSQTQEVEMLWGRHRFTTGTLCSSGG